MTIYCVTAPFIGFFNIIEHLPWQQQQQVSDC